MASLTCSGESGWDGFATAVGNSQGLMSLVGQAVARIYDRDAPLPYNEQWNFSVQRRFGAQQSIEVRDPALHACMVGVLQHPPFEAFLVRPLAPLSELPAHEQELLARMRPHVAVECAQVGELLPVVARHLADQRALAVDDLVVR